MNKRGEGVDLGAIEETLRRRSASPILIDPRLLRRVIKRHRDLPGLGLDVPHARSYVLRREALLSIATPRELGRDEGSLPADILLLPRPAPDDLLGKEPADVLRLLWRSTFHARIHLEIDRRLRSAALTRAMIRERIHRIGETEFDEIRLVLRSDELLLPPHDDLETYAEFAALYLELRHFSPAIVERDFPTLSDLDRVDSTLAADLDVARLLEESRPEGAAEASGSSADDLSALLLGRWMASPRLASPARDLVGAHRAAPANAARALAAADRERARGNAVRSAILRLGVGDEASLEGARADLSALSARLCRALDVPEEHAFTPIFLTLARRAGPRRGLRHTIEARLLYDLQRAAVAHERALRAVDVIAWALSLGRRPVIRALPATRSVRIARYVRAAVKKASSVRIAEEDRARLEELLHEARERAEHNVRSAIRPTIERVLGEIGLVPANAPERVALAKITEELLDQVEAHGFFGIGHLRDAFSRNQLKLADVAGPLELVRGDALIKANGRLDVELEGVYRGAEIYLRGLQKLSSVIFGTRPGRFLTRGLILPLGASFVLLEGVGHIVSLLAHILGFHLHLHLLNRPSFLITAAVIFGLLNSAKIRAFGVHVLSAIAFVLLGVFYRLPRFLLRLPLLQRIARSRPLRLLLRWGGRPAALAAAAVLVTPLKTLATNLRAGVGIALFLGFSVALNSQTGILAEELLLDWLVRRWRFVSRRIIPGLLRLVGDFFRQMLEAFERGIYRVDEILRFRAGERTLALVVKAALGAVWFFVAYLFRIYINLLIEPQINPLKHFPVVTVSHKLVLPFFPQIVPVLAAPLAPLGKVLAKGIAGATTFLLPGVFGFLVWEFKENWKLYRATRPEALHPALIGHHGETMVALMKPGFHSGTLPKLYAKLRRAARRKDASLAHHKEALHEVEEAVSRFIDRELLSLLAEAPRFRSGPVEVERARLASNRVRLELRCPRIAEESAWIDFEEQSGFLVASVPRAGWIARLPEQERQIFENALAGLYQLAGVDLSREQVEAELRRAFGVTAAPPYDISAEGLVVWPVGGAPEEAYRTEVVYPLSGDAARDPLVRGEPPSAAPPPLDREAILCQHHPVRWADWVLAWDAAQGGEDPIPRVQRGASLLPGER